MTPHSNLRSRGARRPLMAVLTAVALITAPAAHAHGGGSEVSEASALSGLSIAASVVAPVGLLSAGAVLTVTAVKVTADGVVWVLERAADGVSAVVTLGASAAVGTSVAVGTVVTCSAVGTGWVLSAAGEALLYVPDALGASLLYDQRVTW